MQTEPPTGETVAASNRTNDSPPDADEPASVWNIPNALCSIRLIGAPFLVYLASENQLTLLVALFAVLLVTDWLDGKLASLLKQTTAFGARLDSVADATLAVCMILSVWFLRPDIVQSESLGLLAIVSSYAVSIVVCLLRFGRMPSYHTWTAKLAWWLVTIGAVALFFGGPIWPLRVAIVAVVIANLEAIGITLALAHWRSDVRSIIPLLRRTT